MTVMIAAFSSVWVLIMMASTTSAREILITDSTTLPIPVIQQNFLGTEERTNLCIYGYEGVINKRAAFYIANDTMCIVDGEVYLNGDPVPTDDHCEKCTCRPPGFSCVLRDCEVKPGCKAVRKDGECCPDYICGCSHNGNVYKDGDFIRDLQNPCYTCRCHGSSISCTFADCLFRSDCGPEYVQGECCPRYDHCPPLSTTQKTTTVITTIPITYDETTMPLFNLTSPPHERLATHTTIFPTPEAENLDAETENTVTSETQKPSLVTLSSVLTTDALFGHTVESLSDRTEESSSVTFETRVSQAETSTIPISVTEESSEVHGTTIHSQVTDEKSQEFISTTSDDELTQTDAKLVLGSTDEDMSSEEQSVTKISHDIQTEDARITSDKTSLSFSSDDSTKPTSVSTEESETFSTVTEVTGDDIVLTSTDMVTTNKDVETSSEYQVHSTDKTTLTETEVDEALESTTPGVLNTVTMAGDTDSELFAATDESDVVVHDTHHDTSISETSDIPTHPTEQDAGISEAFDSSTHSTQQDAHVSELFDSSTHSTQQDAHISESPYTPTHSTQEDTNISESSDAPTYPTTQDSGLSESSNASSHPTQQDVDVGESFDATSQPTEEDASVGESFDDLASEAFKDSSISESVGTDSYSTKDEEGVREIYKSPQDTSTRETSEDEQDASVSQPSTTVTSHDGSLAEESEETSPKTEHTNFDDNWSSTSKSETDSIISSTEDTNEDGDDADYDDDDDEPIGESETVTQDAEELVSLLENITGLYESSHTTTDGSSHTEHSDFDENLPSTSTFETDSITSSTEDTNTNGDDVNDDAPIDESEIGTQEEELVSLLESILGSYENSPTTESTSHAEHSDFDGILSSTSTSETDSATSSPENTNDDDIHDDESEISNQDEEELVSLLENIVGSYESFTTTEGNSHPVPSDEARIQSPTHGSLLRPHTDDTIPYLQTKTTESGNYNESITTADHNFPSATTEEANVSSNSDASNSEYSGHGSYDLNPKHNTTIDDIEIDSTDSFISTSSTAETTEHSVTPQSTTEDIVDHDHQLTESKSDADAASVTQSTVKEEEISKITTETIHYLVNTDEVNTPIQHLHTETDDSLDSSESMNFTEVIIMEAESDTEFNATLNNYETSSASDTVLNSSIDTESSVDVHKATESVVVTPDSTESSVDVHKTTESVAVTPDAIESSVDVHKATESVAFTPDATESPVTFASWAVTSPESFPLTTYDSAPENVAEEDFRTKTEEGKTSLENSYFASTMFPEQQTSETDQMNDIHVSETEIPTQNFDHDSKNSEAGTTDSEVIEDGYREKSTTRTTEHISENPVTALPSGDSTDSDTSPEKDTADEIEPTSLNNLDETTIISTVSASKSFSTDENVYDKLKDENSEDGSYLDFEKSTESQDEVLIMEAEESMNHGFETITDYVATTGKPVARVTSAEDYNISLGSDDDDESDHYTLDTEAHSASSNSHLRTSRSTSSNNMGSSVTAQYPEQQDNDTSSTEKHSVDTDGNTDSQATATDDRPGGILHANLNFAGTLSPSFGTTADTSSNSNTDSDHKDFVSVTTQEISKTDLMNVNSDISQSEEEKFKSTSQDEITEDESNTKVFQTTFDSFKVSSTEHDNDLKVELSENSAQIDHSVDESHSPVTRAITFTASENLFTTEEKELSKTENNNLSTEEYTKDATGANNGYDASQFSRTTERYPTDAESFEGYHFSGSSKESQTTISSFTMDAETMTLDDIMQEDENTEKNAAESDRVQTRTPSDSEEEFVGKVIQNGPEKGGELFEPTVPVLSVVNFHKVEENLTDSSTMSSLIDVSLINEETSTLISEKHDQTHESQSTTLQHEPNLLTENELHDTLTTVSHTRESNSDTSEMLADGKMTATKVQHTTTISHAPASSDNLEHDVSTNESPSASEEQAILEAEEHSRYVPTERDEGATLPVTFSPNLDKTTEGSSRDADFPSSTEIHVEYANAETEAEEVTILTTTTDNGVANKYIAGEALGEDLVQETTTKNSFPEMEEIASTVSSAIENMDVMENEDLKETLEEEETRTEILINEEKLFNKEIYATDFPDVVTQDSEPITGQLGTEQQNGTESVEMKNTSNADSVKEKEHDSTPVINHGDANYNTTHGNEEETESKDTERTKTEGELSSGVTSENSVSLGDYTGDDSHLTVQISAHSTLNTPPLPILLSLGVTTKIEEDSATDQSSYSEKEQRTSTVESRNFSGIDSTSGAQITEDIEKESDNLTEEPGSNTKVNDDANEDVSTFTSSSAIQDESKEETLTSSIQSEETVRSFHSTTENSHLHIRTHDFEKNSEATSNQVTEEIPKSEKNVPRVFVLPISHDYLADGGAVLEEKEKSSDMKSEASYSVKSPFIIVESSNVSTQGDADKTADSSKSTQGDAYKTADSSKSTQGDADKTADSSKSTQGDADKTADPSNSTQGDAGDYGNHLKTNPEISPVSVSSVGTNSNVDSDQETAFASESHSQDFSEGTENNKADHSEDQGNLSGLKSTDSSNNGIA